jgi:hypothetical protein
MKTIAIVLTAIVGLLSGCVAYEVPGPDRGSRQMEPERRHHRSPDYDRDGVPDRRDRRPDDPRRY